MGEPVLSTEQTQRSLWLGDLAPWIDENFLVSLFVGTNQLVSVKLIRNRVTGVSEGYAFLEFRTHDAADTILKTYNGHPIPGTDLVFRLNWAAYGVGKTQPAGEDFSLFVGDLAPDVTDVILQEYFRQFYPSVRSAKVITDATTARSKGYGFVRFASEVERDRALNEMNGHFLSNRPIRVSLATARKNALPGGTAIPQLPHPSDFDPTNTTLFIGGLSSQVSEDQLRAVFARFGDIIYVKIPQGKGCGFVQFVLRTSAERAMMSMNGQVLGNSAIRISWGRSSSRAANQLSANQMTGLASGFPAGGPPGNLGNFPGGPPFAGMPPDPMLFAAVAAGGYGNVPSTAGQFVPQSVPTSINNDFANINLNAMNMMANGMAGPPAGMEMLSVNQYGMPAYTPSPADSLAGTSPPPGLLNGNGVGVGGDSLHSGMGLNGISLPVMIPQPANQVLPTDASNPNSHPESVVEGPNARSSAGASPAKDGPPMMKEFDMGRVGALANTSSKPISNANAIMNTNTNGRTNSGSDGHSGIGKSSSGISEHAGKAVVTQYNPAGKSASSGTMPGAQLLASLLV